MHLEAGESETLTFALSWYYPHHLWGSNNLGHYYEILYSSAEDVAAMEAPRLGEIVDSIQKWHDVCFQNALPPSVQDSLVNTPATWGKTALFTKDSRWRQFESHSCTQVLTTYYLLLTTT